MIPGVARQSPHDPTETLRAGIIAYLHLSDAAVARIEERMVDAGLSFGEAAIACDVVTHRELGRALEWLRQAEALNRDGIIESALRQRGQGQVVLLAHAAQVKPGPGLLLAHDPYHRRSETVRSLRTELLMIDQRRRSGANVLALVSPSAQEGRSLLAAELAIAFAQIGRRTLLVDTDLRRPGLHSLFETGNEWGLMQALAFSEPPRLLGVEGLPQLSFLTAGSHPSNPLELLSDGRFERLLSGWRRSFDYIILDTPPVSEYSDGLAVATLAGGVLILMRAAATSHADMKELLRRLGSTRARILGAVMSHF